MRAGSQVGYGEDMTSARIEEALPLVDAPRGIMLDLLYDFPAGSKWVHGIYREGVFWGRQVEGWWSGPAGEKGGMWIDGWIKGWRPLSKEL